MVWTMVGIGVVLLVAILVFILQNGQRVRVRFLMVDGTLPLGVALLFAALLGALLVLVAGAARVLQLRVVATPSPRRPGIVVVNPRPPRRVSEGGYALRREWLARQWHARGQAVALLPATAAVTPLKRLGQPLSPVGTRRSRNG